MFESEDRVRAQSEPRPVRLRPVRNVTMDVCRPNPPVSAIRSDPIVSGTPLRSPPGLTQSAVSLFGGGCPVAGRAPYLPSVNLATSQLGPIVSYKVERGAMVPVYGEAPAEAALSKGRAAQAVPVVPLSKGGGTAETRESLIVRAYPETFGTRETRTTDPDFPGNDGDEFGQCCCCGVEVSLVPFPFCCTGFSGDGSSRCLHVMCGNCTSFVTPTSEFQLCPCEHFENAERRVFVDPSAEALPKGRAAAEVSADPMLELLREFKTELVAVRASESNIRPHSVMKTNTQMNFTMGSEEALADLDSWLREFDRVMLHVSGGQMIAQDKITHLLSCWPQDTDVGENMRMDQQSSEYLEAESQGDMERCWLMLLARLNTYRVEPCEARKRAEGLWLGLYWPGDIETFHTLLRRAVTAMRRVHQSIPDHQIIIKYLELLPRDKAKQLEDPPSSACRWMDLRRSYAHVQRAFCARSCV